MVRDFGGAARPTWRKGQRLAVLRLWGGQLFLLAALLLIATLPIAMPLSLEQTRIWGHGRAPPPRACRTITAAEFDRGWHDEARTFSFSGVTFARRRGDADCSAAKHGLFGVIGAIYPTCRFDVPFALAVTNGGETRYFAVPPGETAVVEAAPSETRCKVTGHFDIYAITG